jgi:superfamily II DNA/RNA helicase
MVHPCLNFLIIYVSTFFYFFSILIPFFDIEKRRVESMKDAKFTLECFHGGMTAEERKNRMEEFRKGSCRVLISTDVTARGIDVQQVSTVINFDVPKCVHTYLHRIGRSGRWGRKGLAINFITKRDVFTMKKIEKYYNISIDELPGTIKEG